MTTPTAGRVSLDSGTLAAAAYDACGQELQLDFRDGTRYAYSGVAPALYRDLLCAVSKGFFFNRYIRDHFPYVKLPAEN
jgi:hypothetical protein